MQKQKGKLVFSKSGISINWPVARPRYEIYVIKISASPEKRKIDFFKLFRRDKSVP